MESCLAPRIRRAGIRLGKAGLASIVGGLAFGLAPIAVQASHAQAILGTEGISADTVFTGGATINDGVSYLPEIPASEPADLLVTLRPAAADVGQEASIVIIAQAPGFGAYQKTPGDGWLAVDLDDLSTLQPYAARTLGESEEFTIFDDLVGDDADLAGVSLNVWVGYFTGGSLDNLTYAASPVTLNIAETAVDSCPANTRPAVAGELFKERPVCILEGRITSDTHLTSNFAYLLNGGVFIGENELGSQRTSLIIDAGTWVFGQQGLNFLVVDRGGEIHANGSRSKPVIFTYEYDDEADEFTTGQWGGIILNGNAPLNISGGFAEGEGNTGAYGGEDAADSSGVLTFVQVKYAGQNVTEENELNGIGFQGTGSGTLVDYIQVHNNSDDGMEFYGGSTNARHVLLSGNEDDALDWTFGWSGKMQFVAIRQNSASEHCIEADNNSDNNDALPRANPTISNLTCNGIPGEDISGIEGLRLREGTSARLSNFVLGNFGAYCVDIDQTATFTAAGGSIENLNGSLTLTNSRLDADCAFDEQDDDLFPVAAWFGAQTGSALGGVDLGGGSGLINGAGLNAVEAAIPDDPFFYSVDHIGAIKDEASDWTAGWTYSD